MDIHVGGIIPVQIQTGTKPMHIAAMRPLYLFIHGLPLVKPYGSPFFWLGGIFMNANRDNADMDEFMEQLTRVLEG